MSDWKKELANDIWNFICCEDSIGPQIIEGFIANHAPTAGVGPDNDRIKQLELNCKWLIDKIDVIHDALCPEKTGTWQGRAQQAANAAVYLSRAEGEAPQG